MSAPTTLHSLPVISWCLVFPLAMFAKNQDMKSSFYLIFNIIIHTYRINWLLCQAIRLFDSYMINMELLLMPVSVMSQVCLYASLSNTTPSNTAISKSSVFSCLVVIDLSSLTSLWWYILRGAVGVYLVKLPVVVPVLSSNLEYL